MSLISTAIIKSAILKKLSEDHNATIIKESHKSVLNKSLENLYFYIDAASKDLKRKQALN